MPSRGEVLDLLRADPSRTAILTDFDGTLSPIVDDPASARPAAGALEVLRALAHRFGRVGVVSGRPLSFLRDVLGDVAGNVWLAGVYGLEVSEMGVERDHAGADEWRPVVAAVTARAAERFGALAEGKGLSLTVHFRTAPERAAEVEAWAAEEATGTGLLARPAKASVELHPPIAVDKATVAAWAAAGMTAACYIGDDLGDLPAFDGMDRLAASGTRTAKIAVVTSESPPELLARADLVVDGTAAVVELLRELAEGQPSAART